MVSRFLKECTTLFYFYFSPILKSLVVRVYDLFKDPRMLVAIRSRYQLTLMVSRFLKECTTLFYFYFSSILKSLVVRFYVLIKDPSMLVAIRSMYELT